MAGQHGGVAFAVHDIEIPANVYGWEVDLNQPHDVVRVFIPNQCGNISYLRVPRRRVAAVAPYHFKPVAYATPAPIIAAAPIYVVPQAEPTVAPVAFVPAPAPAPAAVSHHFVFWPFLAAALVGFALSSHGSNSSTPPGTVAPKPVASCAPAAAIRI